MTVDLRTRYLGLELRSPIVASASPLNGVPATARLIAAAGAGAIVLPSLFEEEILAEEIELDRSLDQGSEAFAEALGYFPAVPAYAGVADRYLDGLARIRAEVEVPVIASLNAATTGGWVRYARLIEDAGADALELNLYHVAADPGRTAADMETVDLELIAAVRAAVTIPLAVKLSPFYSAFANFARMCVAYGADGLVLFNRFYQPDIDLETLQVEPRLDLSQSWEMRLPARWIAILRPQFGPGVSLAASSGAPDRVRRGQGPDRGRRRGHDDVGDPASRPGSHPDGRSGASRVADRKRLRVGPPAPRECESGDRRRPGRIRTRQLHAHTAILGHADRADCNDTDPPGALKTPGRNAVSSPSRSARAGR